MFLIITRDTMFFTAMKNILSKGNVVHIQNEEEIDVMLHQNAFVIIDTLMNNVFHSNFLTQIERLKPVHVIIFSPFNIKRCLGKVPVTFVPRTITIINKGGGKRLPADVLPNRSADRTSDEDR